MGTLVEDDGHVISDEELSDEELSDEELSSNLAKQTEKPLEELSQNPYMKPYAVYVTADIPHEVLNEFLKASYDQEMINPDLLLLPTADPKSLVSQLPSLKVSKPPLDSGFKAPFTSKYDSLEDVNRFIESHLANDKSVTSLIHTEVYVVLDATTLKDSKTCVLCHNLIEHRRNCDKHGYDYTAGMEQGEVMGRRALFRSASSMMGNFSTGNLDLSEVSDTLKEGDVIDL